PPAEYLASENLPVEVKCALEWLATVFNQQMSFWGWGDDDLDEPSAPPLVYQISEADLDKLQQCLRRLDEALAAHPSPPRRSDQAAKGPKSGTATAEEKPAEEKPKSSRGWTRDDWKAFVASMPPSPPPPKGPKFAKVRKLDGKEGVVNLTASTRWAGRD